MRLRSSQFVFLLLLVCSVQNREDYALHLTAGAVSRTSSLRSQHRESPAAIAQRSLPANPPRLQARLDAGALRAQGTPWSVRRPALDAAAISSFTGFLRA